jgi:HAD superfamily hydrolase (TIGR01484 family)
MDEPRGSKAQPPAAVRKPPRLRPDPSVAPRALPERPARARPLTDLPAAALRRVVGLMTDIDDTLTRDGVIEPAALAALHALHDCGVPVIAITGRPLGWSEPFARAWPLAALVAENGAVALIPHGNTLHTEFAQDAATRTRNTARLQAAAARVLRELPGTSLARDSAARVTDIAIDHGEFARLDEATIARVVALMQAEGMNATVSSIHVNGWFGEHNKWTAACWMVQRLFGRSLHGEADRWVYVGDSTNDQPLFARFALSVGVSNLMRFADQLHTWPAWLAQGERGAGFAEVAARLLAARGRHSE